MLKKSLRLLCTFVEDLELFGKGLNEKGSERADPSAGSRRALISQNIICDMTIRRASCTKNKTLTTDYADSTPQSTMRTRASAPAASMARRTPMLGASNKLPKTTAIDEGEVSLFLGGWKGSSRTVFSIQPRRWGERDEKLLMIQNKSNKQRQSTPERIPCSAPGWPSKACLQVTAQELFQYE